MRLGTLLERLGAAAFSLAYAVTASSQSVSQEKPQFAEEVFKNVQVLKGTSVNEFMGTMGFFSASLGLNCTDCHISESSGDWAKYADDTALKRTTRRMVLMVNGINKNNFGGQRTVTCYSCHRGSLRPTAVPSLLQLIGRGAATASADQILDKYLQALGQAQKLSNITTITAKGTYEGFDTDLEPLPLEIFAKSPGQRAAVVHLRSGDAVTTYDGRGAWISSPDKPVPLITLNGQDIDGVRLEAALAFPAGIKQTFGQWRAGFPKTMIEDREVQVVRGTSAAGSRVKLFFDKQTGLLTRTVRYTDTAVGINPTQTDYSDYREIAGIKMPFHWVVTWTDGQSTVQLNEIRPNVAIDASRLAKPAPAPAPKPAGK